jgi:hypothetical protein
MKFASVLDSAIWLLFILACMILFNGDPDIADALREIVLKKAGMK